MTTTRPLEIKVVYSASKRHRRRGRLARVGGVAGPVFLVCLGALNLAAAAGMYYGTWWRVDKFLYFKFVTTVQLPGLDVDVAGGLLVPASGATPRSTPAPTPEVAADANATFSGQTANVVLGVTAYSWLTLATITTCALALSSGRALGRAGGSLWRLAGIVLMLGLAAVLAWWGYGVGVEHGMQYKPSQLRIGMGGLTLLLFFVGLAGGRGVRRWTYAASILLILSAVASVIGLYLGSLSGAIAPGDLPMALLPSLGLVFVIQSLWGWILLPLASRVSH